VRGKHLSAEEVVRYVGLPPRVVEAIIEHVETCKRCQRIVVRAVRASRRRFPSAKSAR